MYGNPYFNQQRYNQLPMANQQPMPTQNTYMPPIMQPISQPSLLGKIVDSVDVVKAMDIPLDGSVSYFPLTDGSAIVTKQLQNDGTSKTVVYKPVSKEKEESPRFVTFEDLEEKLSSIDFADLEDIKDDLKEVKKQLKEFKTKKGKDE